MRERQLTSHPGHVRGAAPAASDTRAGHAAAAADGQSSVIRGLTAGRCGEHGQAARRGRAVAGGV